MSRFTRTVILLFTAITLATALPAPKAWASKIVVLGTTTSTENTGLLNVLLPMFEKRSGYRVKAIAVGTGLALKMGERGEADVLLVHAPEAENSFMKRGFGVNRKLVMHNDFILLGPSRDPARVRGTRTAAEAFRRIATSGSLFISRGDNSGSHAKEMEIWAAARIKPERQSWYQQTGAGMGETLITASQNQGYVLSDRGTFLALDKKKRLALLMLLSGEPNLLNVYHVIEANPAKWPYVNTAGARAFSDFIVSPQAQEVIRTFGKKEYGAPLFFPDAGKIPELLGL